MAKKKKEQWGEIPAMYAELLDLLHFHAMNGDMEATREFTRVVGHGIGCGVIPSFREHNTDEW